MLYDRRDIGPFRTYKADWRAGQSQLYVNASPVPAHAMNNALVFVRGKFAYGPFPGGMLTLAPGNTSLDVPDRPAGHLTMVALEDGLYYCISPLPKDHRVLVQKHEAACEVPTGCLAVLPDGPWTINGESGEGHMLVYAQHNPAHVESEWIAVLSCEAVEPA